MLVVVLKEDFTIVSRLPIVAAPSGVVWVSEMPDKVFLVAVVIPLA